MVTVKQLDNLVNELREQFYWASSDDAFAYARKWVAFDDSLAEAKDILTRFSINTSTAWFREFLTLEAFYQHILPDLNSRGITEPNVLSVACSSGEEVWSILFKGIEKGKNSLRIEGMDINPDSIISASNGEYSADHEEFIRLKPYLAEGYLHITKKNAETYELRVDKSLIGKAAFFQQDILDSSPDKKYYTIFCLNFLYHLSEQGIIKAITNMANAVEPTGYLVLEQEATRFRDMDDLERNQKYVASLAQLNKLGFKRIDTTIRIKTNKGQEKHQFYTGRLYQKCG